MERATVRLENTGKALAFQVRLKLVDAGTGSEFLPVFWDDNYLALMPGETRDVAVEYSGSGSATPALEIEGWNVPLMKVARGGR